DEFQDTNQLQYDIITSIVPELIGKTGSVFEKKEDEGVNLFVVGDAKQSIYGFRNADVRVFNKASRDIYNFNQNRFVQGEISEKFMTPSGEMSAQKDEEIRGNLELSSSFRLAALNAAFVNKVCGNIMNADDSDYDVEYTPFVCGHKSIGLFADRNTMVEPVDLSEFAAESGTAEILLYVDESAAQAKKTDSENSELIPEEPSIKNEGELLALRIKELVESEDNEYTYGNVAVLSRSRTKFPALAEAFREFDLPYILHSGNGFFETQEISDIISILNFLHNPYDDISLTGALKSPFFSLSDTILLKININHSENWKYSADPLWDKLQGFCTADSSESEEFDDSAAAKRAVSILSDLLSHAASMTIASLIGEILNRTTWRAAVRNMRGKEQAEANIEKLISYARDFENRGFRNMFDFTEELKLIIDSNVNEGEAVFSASTDAINVMTIHASKGLEFPVVALYNSNSRSGRPENFFVNEKFGISFSTLVADQQSGVRKTASTLLHELNRDMKKVSE
ncbi:MAG: UvrD-helicase domain-containing protein, partial [Chlorobi bacterium]|nr:UvrD-helicase domain-containing protein [Chlorobiota bacterium]